MTRRDALLTIGAGVLGGAALDARRLSQAPGAVVPKRVDPDFVRMWKAAQSDRSAVISHASRIARPNEPGTPLVVRGRLYREDGRQPAANTVIFGYQTDRDGLYSPPGVQGWRLRGWAKTDAHGSFEFTTIRPAPYPGRNTPAHIHLSADGPSVARQTLVSVQFADDPLHTAEARQAAARAGRFTDLCPVTTADGVQQCEMLFRLTGEYLF
jgi:protocatechuate 3,4-dioxygenase beta subunit